MYSVASSKGLTRGVALFSSSLFTQAEPTHDCVLRRRINIPLEVANRATYLGQALDPGVGGLTMGVEGRWTNPLWTVEI
jgi:hypothetical protein